MGVGVVVGLVLGCVLGASATPIIALEGSYIPEPPEALEQLTFLRSPLEG